MIEATFLIDEKQIDKPISLMAQFIKAYLEKHGCKVTDYQLLKTSYIGEV